VNHLGSHRGHERIAEDSPDRDRWLVSYADFITLLMAFFVVMYSVSSVNSGKFRVLSNSMVTVFNEKRPPGGEAPIDLGGGARPETEIRIAPQSVTAIEQAAAWDNTAQTEIEVAPLPHKGTPKERLDAALGPLTQRDDVRIRDSRDWLEVELASELLFTPGSAELQPKAIPALRRIATIVIEMNKPVRIEGHTDSTPLQGGRFGSNWHLSAARAATIGEQMTILKVAPEQISVVGYGEFRPLEDNATLHGRSRNRRVVLAIAKTATAAAGTSITTGPEAARTLQRVTELPPAAEIGP